MMGRVREVLGLRFIGREFRLLVWSGVEFAFVFKSGQTMAIGFVLLVCHFCWNTI